MESPPLLIVRERSSVADSLGAGDSSRMADVVLLWEECEERGRTVVLSILSFRLAESACVELWPVVASLKM